MTITNEPIKTEAEYQTILKQIDAIIDCPEGSPEEDLLEIMSILVDDYENINYPIVI